MRAACRLGLALLFISVAMPEASLGQPLASPVDKQEAIGRAAIVGYSANVNGFRYYKCRYRCTKAQASSVEDAVLGQLTNSSSYDNRLLVDSDKYLYEGFAPAPNLMQTREMPGKKGGFLPSLGHSDKYLSDGKREMNYEPFLHAVNLYSDDTTHHGVAQTPLGFGDFVGHRSNHGPDALVAQPDKYSYEFVRFEEIDKRPVITVRFRDKRTLQLKAGPLAFAHIYSFDPARGYLPIRMANLWNEKPKTQVFVTHVRECSKQRWFPERTVIIRTADQPGGLCDVFELKVLELDTETVPGPEEFFFVIPAGTSVKGDTDNSKFFKLKQAERIHINDLPTLFKMLDQVGAKPLMDTGLSEHRPWSWKRWAGTVGGLALVLVGAGVVVRRRYGAKHSLP